jgi:hypothetical protein
MCVIMHDDRERERESLEFSEVFPHDDERSSVRFLFTFFLFGVLKGFLGVK